MHYVEALLLGCLPYIMFVSLLEEKRVKIQNISFKVYNEGDKIWKLYFIQKKMAIRQLKIF